MMHGPEKSDSVVVAMKPTNKAGLDWGSQPEWWFLVCSSANGARAGEHR
jgi:hypothetical protein